MAELGLACWTPCWTASSIWFHLIHPHMPDSKLRGERWVTKADLCAGLLGSALATTWGALLLMVFSAAAAVAAGMPLLLLPAPMLAASGLALFQVLIMGLLVANMPRYGDGTQHSNQRLPAPGCTLCVKPA